MGEFFFQTVMSHWLSTQQRCCRRMTWFSTLTSRIREASDRLNRPVTAGTDHGPVREDPAEGPGMQAAPWTVYQDPLR